jgi:hypothetical protein
MGYSAIVRTFTSKPGKPHRRGAVSKITGEVAMTIHLQDLLEVAAALLAGLAIGRRRRRRFPTQPAKPRAPLCSCTHGLNYHDVETGLCHAKIPTGGSTLTVFDDQGRNLGEERQLMDCPCRRYIGPEPLPDLWIPPMPGTKE